MPLDPASGPQRDYTPAAPQLWLYDFLVAVLAREARWRQVLLKQLNPTAGDVIADIGCGTGSQLTLIGRVARSATLIGIDPDPEILERARTKTAAAGVTVDFKRGYAREAAELLRGRGVNKVVSSLVFHQVPLAEKQGGLAAMRAALVPQGDVNAAEPDGTTALHYAAYQESVVWCW